MVQTIIPRPIAWVLTHNHDKTTNLAPYSFFTGVCSDPPIIVISAGKKASGDETGIVKDTARNILRDGVAVVHISSVKDLQPLNASAATLNYGVSELDSLKLSTTEFGDFALPRLSESKLAMACRLHKSDEIGNTPQTVLYMEILDLFVDDRLLVTNEAGRLIIDPERVKPLARLGGAYYAQLGDLLTTERPD